jgi:hypothetical protein
MNTVLFDVANILSYHVTYVKFVHTTWYYIEVMTARYFSELIDICVSHDLSCWPNVCSTSKQISVSNINTCIQLVY